MSKADSTKIGRLMKLAAIVHTGTYTWVAEESYPEGMNLQNYTEVAQLLERGLFDVFFLGDGLAVGRGLDLKGSARSGNAVTLEPFTLLTVLSQVTKNIGLIGTASTTYNHPYHIARRVGSLDIVSDSRAGWNLVTSTLEAEARNFGLSSQIKAGDRYARANEFYDATVALWNSWEPDAFIRDKKTGVFFDIDKMHFHGHHGAEFDIGGPLNVPRSPQGVPVISQAGASDQGVELAARGADIMYGSAASIGPAKAFYRQVKDRLPKYGRQPHELSIMPGMLAIAGRTKMEAEDKFARVQKLLDFEAGKRLLGGYFLTGVDLSPYGPDDELPDTPEIRAFAALRGFDLAAAGPDRKLRRLADWASSCFCHLLVIGTASDIADVMQEWFEGEAADGFNMWSHRQPGTYQDFVELVVPELQRRGIYKTAYAPGTLRQKLGLREPRIAGETRAAAE